MRLQGNGRWDVSKNAKGEWTVMHRDFKASKVSDCGKNHPDTKKRTIIDWVMQYAEPGDSITLFGVWFGTVASPVREQLQTGFPQPIAAA